MIELKQVTYRYPGAEQPALRDVSLSIPEGQFCAVVGKNGAGKSTLAYTMAGFIPHFYHGVLSGSVVVGGMDTQATPLEELVNSIGLIYQNPYNQITGTKFTVREEVAFGLENLGVPRPEMERRIADILELIGIDDLAGRFPLSLSGGQMQRVAIASVLVMRPRVLLLDEPTSQLDPVGSREVFSALRGLMEHAPMTVVICEHKLEWLAVYADRMLVLAEGMVVMDGAPTEVLTDDRLLALGVGQTRYTQAARLAQNTGLWPDGAKLAVTLDEAVEGFKDSGNPG
ncbi:MAG: energy-coupling factor ABC transporter ATP-binding protein [Omnitrophica WOR_2 bacterium]